MAVASPSPVIAHEDYDEYRCGEFVLLAFVAQEFCVACIGVQCDAEKFAAIRLAKFAGLGGYHYSQIGVTGFD